MVKLPRKLPEQQEPRIQMPSGIGAVPNPDPTVRTVEQLQREIATSREVVETSQTGVREVLDTRISAIEKSIELLAKTNDMIPQHIVAAVGKLEALHNEKFRSIEEQIAIQFGGIDKQFSQLQKQTELLSLADKTAIAAALQAQKEAAGAQNESNTAAINKMEANFIKLIDQGQNLLKQISDGLDGKINDIKSRLDKGEGRSDAVDPSVSSAISGMMGDIRMLRESREAIGGHAGGVKDQSASTIAMVAIGISVFMPILTLVVVMMKG